MIYITRKEMFDMLGTSNGESLYKLALLRVNDTKNKRVGKSFVFCRAFNVRSILKYMDIVKPHKSNTALWQQNKEEIKRVLHECINSKNSRP